MAFIRTLSPSIGRFHRPSGRRIGGHRNARYITELKTGSAQFVASVAGDKSGPTTKGITVRFAPKLFGARHRNFGKRHDRSLSRLAPQPFWNTQTRSPGFKP